MFNKNIYLSNQNDKIFISLGNYCLTSMLLKENKLKYESYPFDWMVSCIDNINDCINNNFNNFLNKKNYINIDNKTKNIKYFSNTNKLFGNLKMDHQHHNLLEENDYNYLYRCVERFNKLNENKKDLIFIMIQPLYLNINIFNEEENKEKIINLYNNLYNKFNKNNIKLIIFIIKNKNNKIFKEEIINSHLKIIELDTEMIVGNYGMMYFDKNGIKKFLQIIQNF